VRVCVRACTRKKRVLPVGKKALLSGFEPKKKKSSQRAWTATECQEHACKAKNHLASFDSNLQRSMMISLQSPHMHALPASSHKRTSCANPEANAKQECTKRLKSTGSVEVVRAHIPALEIISLIAPARVQLEIDAVTQLIYANSRLCSTFHIAFQFESEKHPVSLTNLPSSSFSAAAASTMNKTKEEILAYIEHITQNITLDAQQKRFLHRATIDRACLIILGEAGAGKSRVIGLLKKVFDFMELKLELTGTTGRAGNEIGGTTLDTALGLGALSSKPVHVFARQVEQAGEDAAVRRVFNNSAALLVDEISMARPRLFDLLDVLGKIVTGSVAKFGNLQVILSGDFAQLPAVVDNKKDKTHEWAHLYGGCELSNVKYKYLFQHPKWSSHFEEVIYFPNNYRQKDPVHRARMKRFRFAEPDEIDIAWLRKRRDETVRRMHESKDGVLRGKSGLRPLSIRARNAEIDEINTSEMLRLHSNGPNVHVFHYSGEIPTHIPYREQNSLKELIHETASTCQAGAEVTVMENAPVMLLVNVDLARGLVNSLCGTVTGFTEPMFHAPWVDRGIRYPIVDFVGISDKSTVVFAHAWTVELPGNSNMFAKYIQIPLRLCSAASVHKIQGLSLDEAEMKLSNMRQSGQAYTSVSRVRDESGVYITGEISAASFYLDPLIKTFYQNLEKAATAQQDAQR
jgi:ATP-dependent DNA helicase PIF1